MKEFIKILLMALVPALINLIIFAAVFYYLYPRVGYFG